MSPNRRGHGLMGQSGRCSTPSQRIGALITLAAVVVSVGRSNDEIVAHLGIAQTTLESHLSRICERVGVVSRTEPATRTLSEGWLDLRVDESTSA